jgi:hypothetical protein
VRSRLTAQRLHMLTACATQHCCTMCCPHPLPLTTHSASLAPLQSVNQMSISNYTFASNTANGNGGGVDITSVGLALAEVTFATNIASGDGGGMQVEGGALSIQIAKFYNNNANNAGGLHLKGNIVGGAARLPAWVQGFRVKELVVAHLYSTCTTHGALAP